MHSRRPPVSLTSRVGREREIRDLDALVAARRLVTLTGVGGSGKTRLAAGLAPRIDWKRADSVVWIELAPCNDPVRLAQQVAAAMSLRVADGETAVADGARYLVAIPHTVASRAARQLMIWRKKSFR